MSSTTVLSATEQDCRTPGRGLAEGRALGTDTLRAILDAARFAPSPDNVQYWRFAWNGAELKVFHLNDRARHSLNPENHASYVAFGGLLTYLEQASLAQGYRVHPEFTSDWTQNHWLTLRFEETEVPPEAERLDLGGRWTDREPYMGGALDDAFWSRCRQHLSDGVRLHHAPVTRELSQYIELGELLFLVSGIVNKDVLEWVNFDAQSARSSPYGMPFWSLGANPMETLILKLMKKHPPLRSLLLRAGITWMARGKTRKLLNSSSGCLLVTVPEATPLHLIAAGRASVYGWLHLNQAGFSCQPMSSACFGIHYSRKNQLPADMPAYMLEHFAQGSKRLKECFNLSDDQQPGWMFRFGKTRRRPEKRLTNRATVDSLLSIED